jgi:hypothetical protein
MTTWPRDPGRRESSDIQASPGARVLRERLAYLQRLGARTRVRALAPLAVVVLALILAAGVYYVRWGFAHQAWGAGHQAGPVPVWLAFNDLGQIWASRVGDEADAVPVTGYDGQFYYYMAQNPGVILDCAFRHAYCPIDASPLREERILYPMTARLLSLGNAALLHFVLFALDFVSILITAVLVGQLCVEAGASRWLGVAVALFCGELEGLLRDLADPYAVMWTVLAVYLLRKNRPLLCAAAVSAAVLTREQLVLVLPLLVLPWLVRRQWGTSLLFIIVALGPFLAWQAVLRLLFGQWGLTGSVTTTRAVHWPFSGLWEYRSGPEFAATIAFVAVPLVCTVLVALSWIRHHGLRTLLADPVPLVVLLYAWLATLTAYIEWEGTWASARLVAPAVALGVLVSCGIAAPLRRGYAALLSLTAVVVLVIPPLLY